ncbi:hypothetical protein [Crossiella cryophila]|uniref:Uncharacterized protein n=1 Tax=Crossiella cryophila TaxID=43355 RepID=A0A7W7CAQ6_9PSEU|nr:hypothetical protein [Crossiella cryophila]MBB4677695.1 hypothetical protein [Crossiella cryophila]
MRYPGAHPEHERRFRRFPRLAYVTIIITRVLAGVLGLALLALCALTFRAEPAPAHGRATLAEPCATGVCAVTVTWADRGAERALLSVTRAERDQAAQGIEVWGRKPFPGFWGRTELSTTPPAPQGPRWGLRIAFLLIGGLLLALGGSRRFGPALARLINPAGWRRARRFYGAEAGPNR